MFIRSTEISYFHSRSVRKIILFNTSGVTCCSDDNNTTVEPHAHGSRNFCQGGVQAQPPENSMNIFRVFFSPHPQLILQFTEGDQCFYYRENYTFSKDPEGVQHFLWGGGGGGVQLFGPGGGGGSKCLYFYNVEI